MDFPDWLPTLTGWPLWAQVAAGIGAVALTFGVALPVIGELIEVASDIAGALFESVRSKGKAIKAAPLQEPEAEPQSQD